MAVFEADGRERGRNRKLNFVPKSIVLREGRWKTNARGEKKQFKFLLSSLREKKSFWTSQHIFLLSF